MPRASGRVSPSRPGGWAPSWSPTTIRTTRRVRSPSPSSWAHLCTPTGCAGAEALRSGQRVRAGALDLTAVHTPGHTSDHVAFFEPGSGALFTGDAVLGRGTSFIDPPDGDLVAYLRSLKRMVELDARTIYPGHGPVVLRARDKLLEYLAHREEREAQVFGGTRGRTAHDRGDGRGDLRRPSEGRCVRWRHVPSLRTC